MESYSTVKSAQRLSGTHYRYVRVDGDRLSICDGVAFFVLYGRAQRTCKYFVNIVIEYSPLLEL